MDDKRNKMVNMNKRLPGESRAAYLIRLALNQPIIIEKCQNTDVQHNDQADVTIEEQDMEFQYVQADATGTNAVQADVTIEEQDMEFQYVQAYATEPNAVQADVTIEEQDMECQNVQTDANDIQAAPLVVFTDEDNIVTEPADLQNNLIGNMRMASGETNHGSIVQTDANDIQAAPLVVFTDEDNIVTEPADLQNNLIGNMRMASGETNHGSIVQTDANDIQAAPLVVFTDEDNIVTEPADLQNNLIGNMRMASGETNHGSINESSIQELNENSTADHHENDSEEKRLSRKRQRNPSKWSRAVLKAKRNSGKEYKSTSNKIVNAKSVKPPCTDKCRIKCFQKISYDERCIIHSRYWEINNLERQRDYIVKCLTTVEPKYRLQTPGSNRSKNNAYHFEVNGVKIRVCRVFFINTLDICYKVVETALRKKDSSGIVEPDLRGKHGKGGVKVDIATKEFIREHIGSFPVMPSHYCRAQTTKKYLDGSLNPSIMYRLYVEKCIETNKPYAKQHMYQHIFDSEYNLGFFSPKKDLCAFCEENKNNPAGAQYVEHINNKRLCRTEKEKDIELASQDQSITVGCFDLQAVLTVPCGDISSFFYKRRLNSYNFTIFNISKKHGHCYLWHEGLAKRGANEIGTCLFNFLKDQGTKTTILYSDNCAGQQKNKFVASIFLYAVQSIDAIDEICHKFLVVGHTQNEGDSMHALIEKEKKRCLKGGPIYTPGQLVPIIRLAKKTGKPYSCLEMESSDFIDCKHLQSQIGKNFNINSAGEKVVWADICVLRYMKSQPFKIFYKTNYSQETYLEIDTRHRMRGIFNGLTIKKAYVVEPGISVAKKRDITDLCSSNAVPRQYWDFFEKISTCESDE